MEAGGDEWRLEGTSGGMGLGEGTSWVEEQCKEAGGGGQSRVGGTWPWAEGVIYNND